MLITAIHANKFSLQKMEHNNTSLSLQQQVGKFSPTPVIISASIRVVRGLRFSRDQKAKKSEKRKQVVKIYLTYIKPDVVAPEKCKHVSNCDKRRKVEGGEVGLDFL